MRPIVGTPDLIDHPGLIEQVTYMKKGYFSEGTNPHFSR